MASLLTKKDAGIILSYESLLLADDELTDTQKSLLVTLLVCYLEDDEEAIYHICQNDKVLGVYFKSIRISLDKNYNKYINRCETNRKNIEKRYQNKQNESVQPNTTEYESIQPNTTVSNKINIIKEKENKLNKKKQNSLSKESNEKEDFERERVTVHSICEELSANDISTEVWKRVKEQLPNVGDIRKYTQKKIKDIRSEYNKASIVVEAISEEENKYFLLDPNDLITKTEHDRQLSIWVEAKRNGEEWAKKCLEQYDKAHKNAS